MATDEPRGNITVSREALRAELLSLELRLTEKLNALLDGKANAPLVDQMDKRLTQVETSLAIANTQATEAKSRADKLEAGRKWLYAQAVAVLALIVSMIYVYVDIKSLH